MIDDNLLINKILNGCSISMETLVNSYYNDVYYYLYRITGDYYLANDLTQETFIKMIRF